MVGSLGSSRSTTALTWRSTSSHAPWRMDSSRQLPAEEPLNSFKVLNQSRGTMTSCPSRTRTAGWKRQGTRSRRLAAVSSEMSSCTERIICSRGSTRPGQRAWAWRQVALVKRDSSAQKLKKLKRSASSMRAEASAWAGDAPLPICLRVGITSRAWGPQTER